MNTPRVSRSRFLSVAFSTTLLATAACTVTDVPTEQAAETSALTDRTMTPAEWSSCRWSFDVTGITDAHKAISKPGQGVTIAQIDTGYLPSPHFEVGTDVERGVWLPPVAIGRPFPRLNWYDRDSWIPLDTPINAAATNWGHGATTAGMIVNRASDSLPVSGIAPYARLIPYRIAPSVILGSETIGPFGDVKNMARAIRNAIELDVDVINISMGALVDTGGPRLADGALRISIGDANELSAAIDAAFDAGIIVNAAAGHGVPDYLKFLNFFPASAKPRGANAIAATQPGNIPWAETIASPRVTVSAPGAEVCYVRPRTESWAPGALTDVSLKEIASQYVVKKGAGTSFATAYVSGMAAIWVGEMRRQYPNVPKQKFAKAFKALLAGPGVTVPSGWRKDQYGSGVVNLTKLLRSNPGFGVGN
jgi:Subtilase family